MKRIFFFSALSMAAVVGCDRQPDRDLAYEQLADGDLVARVNADRYTKAELERDVAITEKLSSLAGFAPNEMASRKEPAKFRRQIVNGFVSRALLLQEAARRKIDLRPADMQNYEEKFAAGISSRMPLTFKGLLDALGPEATQFRNNFKKDALSARIEQTLRREFLEAQPAPSAAEIERERHEAIAFNRKLEDANRTLARLATNAWKSIRAGNDFTAVGKKLAQMRKEISFDAAFADPDRHLARAPLNLTLPPKPVNDGLEVVKVTQAPNGARVISRILFGLQAPRPVSSASPNLEALRQKAANSAFSAWLKSRQASASVWTVRFAE